MDGRLLVITACLSCWLLTCRAQSQFVKWRPMDVIARLMVAKIDPAEAYNALEAVKTKPVIGALQEVKTLHLNIEHLYNVLQDMRIDPIDAYFALQIWVKDRSKEEEKKTGSVVQLSEDISSMLNKIVKAFQENSFVDLVGEVKELATTINDPEKLFKDFFGYDKTFQTWKRLHPAIFETVKNILFGKTAPHDPQCNQSLPTGSQPLPQQGAEPSPQAGSQPSPQGGSQPSPQAGSQPFPQTGSQPSPQAASQQPAAQGSAPPPPSPQQPQPSYVNPLHQLQRSLQVSECDLQDPQFADTNRFARIHDETHVYHKGPHDPANTPRQSVHNIRRYFDRQNKSVIEVLKTIEYHESGFKSIRKNIRTVDATVFTDKKTNKK